MVECLTNAMTIRRDCSGLLFLLLVVLCVAQDDVYGHVATSRDPVVGSGPGFTYVDVSDTTLQRLLINNATGQIFVGGRNTMFEFDSQLHQIQRVSTGPVMDELSCHPAHIDTCENATLTDNDAKVMLIDPARPEQLLFCGSVRQGLCGYTEQRNLNSIEYLDPNNIYNYMGGKNETVAFFGERPVSFAASTTPLYVAQIYDNRPMSLSPESVSTRYVKREGAGLPDINLMTNHPQGNVKSAKDIHESIKEWYGVSYIYGFEHRNFTYFLTRQQGYVGFGRQTTRLARICKEDSGYYSYAEIQLQCMDLSHGLPTRKVPLTAYLGPVGTEFGMRFATKDPALFVMFATAEGDNVATNSSYGSGLCMFGMYDIQKEFQLRLIECFNGETELLDWIRPYTRCKADRLTRDDIRADLNYCVGPQFVHNDAIGVTAPELWTYSNYSSAYMATSIHVSTERDKTGSDVVVVMIGTTAGIMLKLLVDGTNQHHHAEINLTQGLDLRYPVGRQLIPDPEGQFLYATVGPRLARVALHSCSIYGDCASCVTAAWRDPLSCGWCDGHCLPQELCAKSSWTTDSCPPLIHSFEPESGPVQGGTAVTIRGQYFGAWDSAARHLVEVAYQQCDLNRHEYTQTSLVCITRSVEKDCEGRVAIEMVDQSKRNYTFNVRGVADSSPLHFAYKRPVLTSVAPLQGPCSGGTPVTLSGRNLDIGTSTTVTVAGLPCTVVRERSTASQLVCKTSTLPPRENTTDHTPAPATKRAVPQVAPEIAEDEDGSGEALARGRVRAQIDAAVLEAAGEFVYYPDPSVTDVQPRRGIASGGVPLTVTGQFLHVVHQPSLVLVDPLLNHIFNATECRYDAEGAHLTCDTPAVFNPRAGTSLPLVVNIHFRMDGVQKMADFPSAYPELSDFTFHPDPELAPLTTSGDGVGRFNVVSKRLVLHGKYLDLGASLEDYRVTVGDEDCPVVELRSDLLVCEPRLPSPLSEQERPRAVTVEVGLRRYSLGSLVYTEGWSVRGAVLAGAGVAVLVLIIVLLIFVCVCFRRSTKTSHGQDHVSVIYRGDGGYYGQEDQAQNARGEPLTEQQEAAPLLNANEYLQLIDPSIILPRNRLTLLEIVGQGNFGCVYKGVLQGGEGKDDITVAVKTLKSLTEILLAIPIKWTKSQNSAQDAQEVRTFLDEALRMREFRHEHVLRLMGICFEDDDPVVVGGGGVPGGRGQPMVVTPFMRHGDLLNYIRDDKYHPTVKDLMGFGIQIAEGMAYLTRLRFVHRDLAARNCMLDDNLRVLVADFGLSRDVYEKEYYSSDGRRARLPVKWMALESLEKGVYNAKTDVWAFGVVLWELMTRGVTPYPDVGNWEITEYLRTGRRMPQSSYCPDHVYDLMMECWDPNPRRRPTFTAMSARLRQIIREMEVQEAQWVAEEAQAAVPPATSSPLPTRRIYLATYANVPTTQHYLYPSNSRVQYDTFPPAASPTSYPHRPGPTPPQL